MLDFLKPQDDEKLLWRDPSRIEDGRQNLGTEMPVFVYRMMQYTLRDELIRQYGKEKMIEIFRNAGASAGREFSENMLDCTLPLNEFLAQLQKILEQSKVGILRVEDMDPEAHEMTLTVSEDLDCSGLPVTGEAVCYYDEGFISGILEAYTKEHYTVKEVDCWATGSRVCRFKAKKA